MPFEMPKPTEHHQKLKKLAGQWSGVEKMFPSEWDPQGGTATGRQSARVSLDGFAVLMDYEQERDGHITYQGHAVWTYDPKESVYVLHWFDSMGSPAEVFKGAFDGDVLTVAHGGPMHARMTYDFSHGAARLNSKMEMSKDGKSWNTFFESTYEKK